MAAIDRSALVGISGRERDYPAERWFATMPTDRRPQSAAEDMAVTDYPTARWFAIAPTDGSKSATRVGQETPPSSLRRKVKVKASDAIFSHVLLNIAFPFLLCMRKVFARIRSCGVLDAAELRSLVVSLLGTVAQLEAKVAALTEEIARLKRLKGRPNLSRVGWRRAPIPHRHRPVGLVARSGGIRSRPRARG